MTDNQGKQPTTKRNTGRAIALGAILLGLLCIAAGILLLNWTPKGASVAAATADTPRPPTSTTKPLKATLTVVPVAPSTLPPDVQEAPPTATPVPLKSELFHLTIVHSNDTWGYLMPCG